MPHFVTPHDGEIGENGAFSQVNRGTLLALAGPSSSAKSLAWF
jgi:hypothetical protein